MEEWQGRRGHRASIGQSGGTRGKRKGLRQTAEPLISKAPRVRARFLEIDLAVEALLATRLLAAAALLAALARLLSLLAWILTAAALLAGLTGTRVVLLLLLIAVFFVAVVLVLVRHGVFHSKEVLPRQPTTTKRYADIPIFARNNPARSVSAR
jgi:hypothetical protein